MQHVAAGRDFILQVGGAPQTVAPPSAAALHQLPPPPGDFTGRKAELEELKGAIEKGGVTISGLRGMGGIGKTALALKLADELRERYPGAQIYLDLKGTSNKPLTTAEVMAYVVRSYQPMAQLSNDQAELAGLYRSMLDGQRALLLMDNAHDAAQVTPLIPPATCILLVTSRQHFTLPGLHVKNLEALPPGDARALLLAIACSTGVPLVNTAETTVLPGRDRDIAAHADEIARLCGYLPLALRAAGGMLAAREDLPPQRYAEQLRDERQRLERLGEEGVEISVEASLKLSYAILEAEAARVFRQLAVFPGSFDAAAEEFVCKDPQHARLSELLRRSLVEYDSASERYRLHDLTRLFAAARRSDQERGEAEPRHAAHYLRVGSAADDLYLQGGDAILVGLRLFDAEWANIREGQAWAAAHAEQDEDAARFCSDYPGVTWALLDLRLHPRERVEWVEAALGAARRLNDRQAEGVHLGNLGLACADLGEVRRAIEYHNQHLLIARETGDRRGQGNALGNLGIAYRRLGELRRAVDYHSQQLLIAREIANRRSEGNAMGSLGIVYGQMGEPRRAIEHTEKAVAIHREIGDRRGEGRGLGNLGAAHLDLGEPRRAIEYSEKNLVFVREIADRRGEGTALGNLGSAYFLLGEMRRAIEYHNRQLLIARETGDRRGEGNALFNMSLALDQLGERAQAITNAEAALKIFVEIEDPKAERVRSKLAEWGAGNCE